MQNEMPKKTFIINHLIKKGVKPHLKGFYYLIAAISYSYESQKRISMSSIYSYVSNLYSATPANIERCMRFAIRCRSNLSIVPSNAEFVYLAVLKMKCVYDREAMSV